ncbi:PulJ/GspJ family protein [Urechidicola croceus]|uniref:Prepilin-type N-terminal cleavage/methylation domain-containing protein n=1 Tax=Urechidicola croceus TaxID=1850246 RepID=A0A1D8P8A2_9FLAO|nr:prepilin-type N-terminal cleavage/methylation domain-containing protein [Urechidicola croceus]AOW20782.1 hypothetical protein LPB138_08875 [Urechidicola croceus]
MRLNKKIESFTLSEMMVVLIISAIVISLAITVLNLVQQQIRSITNNFDKNTEIRLLERALFNDFNTHDLVFNKKENQLICINPQDTILYTFNTEYVLRNKDTLKIKIAENTVYLDAQEVNEKSIDAITLTLSDEFLNKKLFIFKQKDASYYMNN